MENSFRNHYHVRAMETEVSRSTSRFLFGHRGGSICHLPDWENRRKNRPGGGWCGRQGEGSRVHYEGAVGSSRDISECRCWVGYQIWVRGSEKGCGLQTYTCWSPACTGDGKPWL